MYINSLLFTINIFEFSVMNKKTFIFVLFIIDTLKLNILQLYLLKHYFKAKLIQVSVLKKFILKCIKHQIC